VTATATGVADADLGVEPDRASWRSSELAGTATLTRFALRRDRVRIAVWVLSIALLVMSTAGSVKGLYPTQADLDEAAQASEGNAAAIVFNGPDVALDTVGGQIAFQIGAFGLVTVALMSIFVIGRQTRGEEEAGRTELIRALGVGRHAPATASLIVAVIMSLAVGLLVTLALLPLGVPAGGCWVFGASYAATGLVFAGVVLVAAQVSDNTRVVYGLSGAVLGAAFALRAAGDVGDGTLSWLSPIGWAQKTRPFAGDVWWPLLVCLVAAGVLVVGAGVLGTRRDVGGGLIAPSPGPPRAAAALGTPLGLALRLQRGNIVGWSSAMLLMGVAYGSVANDVEDFVGDNDAFKDVIARSGGDLVKAYLSTSMLLNALVAGGFAVGAVLRLRSEETSLHAEPLLATPVPRDRWVASHLVVALAGSVVVLVAGGLGAGVSYGLASHDLGQVATLLGAAVAYAPALWVLVGVALLMFGRVPKAVGVAWGAFGACFLVGFLGEVLGLPGWVTDLSPFDAVPLLAVTAIAAALVATGTLAFRHRDLG
jgi:ABC-2 type transport system permease protein